MGEIIFKTELIKGAKGDRGEAGQADSIPTDGVIAFQGETVPDGYEETDPGDVFDEVYEDINAVKDMIADEYDTTATYNAGDFCTHENGLYKCTATTIGPWDGSKWVLTSASDETKATQDMISDAYDSTHTYNVGDYCIYENVLYKCNTASTTGTWDSSKWVAVTVAEELGELTERVSERYVSVVGDGVKTNQQLLNDLYSLIDATKITTNSRMVMVSGGTTKWYHRLAHSTLSKYEFAGISGIGGSEIYFRNYVVETNLSSCYLRDLILTSGNLQVSDETASVPSNTIEYRLYY